MFSFGSSTGATGNPLFPRLPTQPHNLLHSLKAPLFNLVLRQVALLQLEPGTTGTTGTDGMFKFGISTPTTTGTAAPSTFNYGGIYQIFILNLFNIFLGSSLPSTSLVLQRLIHLINLQHPLQYLWLLLYRLIPSNTFNNVTTLLIPTIASE